MSALLTTTMLEMKKTIQALIQAGLREKVKIIIGGAPVTQAFADQIGADGYAYDAPGAAQKCKDLLAEALKEGSTALRFFGANLLDIPGAPSYPRR